MLQNCATPGEELCTYINQRLLSSAPWGELSGSLELTGRGEDLVGFYRQITAVAMTGRIVSAGLSLSESLGQYDPAFPSEFRTFLREYFQLPYRLLDEVLRFSARAVDDM